MGGGGVGHTALVGRCATGDVRAVVLQECLPARMTLHDPRPLLPSRNHQRRRLALAATHRVSRQPTLRILLPYLPQVEPLRVLPLAHPHFRSVQDLELAYPGSGGASVGPSGR